MQKDTEAKTTNRMAFLIKMEEAAITALSFYFLTTLDIGVPMWAWFLLFFSPDLSIIAYVINTRAGAFIYNLFHHRAVAVIFVAIGLFLTNTPIIAAGILFFSHSSFDRMMGYGLKFNDDFKHTSLGWMGKNKPI